MNIDLFKILSSKPHNTHYLNRYCKFIAYCQKLNESLPTGSYVEKHHILPKSNDMFPEYKKSLWNIVELTLKQHIVAHHILYKVYSNKSQTYAFWSRVNIDGHRLTTKAAAKLLDQYRGTVSGASNHFYGKKHTNPKKCGVQNLGKTPWNKGLSKELDTRIAASEKNYFFGKQFTKEKNPMFGRTTVYDTELNVFRSVTTEEFRLLKNIRYYNPNSRYVKENVN